MEEFTRGRGVARAEDAGESHLDVLAKEKRVLNLRSIEAGGEREKDALVESSGIV